MSYLWLPQGTGTCCPPSGVSLSWVSEHRREGFLIFFSKDCCCSIPLLTTTCAVPIEMGLINDLQRRFPWAGGYAVAPLTFFLARQRSDALLAPRTTLKPLLTAVGETTPLVRSLLTCAFVFHFVRRLLEVFFVNDYQGTFERDPRSKLCTMRFGVCYGGMRGGPTCNGSQRNSLHYTSGIGFGDLFVWRARQHLGSLAPTIHSCCEKGLPQASM